MAAIPRWPRPCSIATACPARSDGRCRPGCAAPKGGGSSRRMSASSTSRRFEARLACAPPGTMPPRLRFSRSSQDQEQIMASSEKDPKHHTERMKRRLQETMEHLRQDIKKVDEPQLAAMFETAAEVLGGLVKAFDDYEKKNEAAWRKSA